MRTSVIFETKALLPEGAPPRWDLPYLNLVVSGKTTLSPLLLLKKLKEIERELGRDQEALRWAPRVIDLDILAFDEEVFAEETLTIPHQELMNRPFLVSLMASLNANFRYPVPGLPYSHLTLGEIIHSHIQFDPGESKCFTPRTHLVGIVNVTPDSFSDGGKYLHAKQAVERIHELAAQGAAVIDIGGESTRPGAISLSIEEEWRRLQPVLDLLQHDFQARPAKPQISLDSYHPEVIERALQHYPIDWINDVSGGKDERLLQIVAKTSCKIVLNHSLTVPASKAVLPFEKSAISSIHEWAEMKIRELEERGISRERIILDPGIGFGKSPLQSLALLREIELLQETGCEILVGHSRKSFLKFISHAPDRDIETVGISHSLVRKGVDYLRVHNVEAHQRSLSAASLLEGLL
jgi:dihydropteroate synthase/2-amino-4-hydroxy-6-hydroxymethyldihydropteridine diphosphokinase